MLAWDCVPCQQYKNYCTVQSVVLYNTGTYNTGIMLMLGLFT